jgi:hypothetical protein
MEAGRHYAAHRDGPAATGFPAAPDGQDSGGRRGAAAPGAHACLAALRIRLAGAGHGGGRLAYLTVGEAARLRARLLAGQHGLDPATPEAAELPVITVPVGRVIGATLLRAAPRFLALAVIARVAATAAPRIFLACAVINEEVRRLARCSCQGPN